MKSKGRGFKLRVRVPGDTVYTRIPDVKSKSFGEETIATSEKPFLDQEPGSVVGHSTGLVTVGDRTFSVEYDSADAGHAILEDNFGKTLEFELEFKPDNPAGYSKGPGETWSGTLIKRGYADPDDSEMIRNYAVKLDDSPVPFSATAVV